MDALELGDQVAVGDGKYSTVIAFTHRQRHGMHEFVGITVGSNVLEATPGHLVYANGLLVTASSVRVGDVMRNETGHNVRVTSVQPVWREGLYNPQTMHGNIVANGVVVSTYTSAIDSTVAHAALAPLRALSAKLGLNVMDLRSGWDSVAT